MQITDNFSLEELIKTSHIEYIDSNRAYALENIKKLQALVKNILEPCRAILGPIIITSCVRCPELNEKVGGSKKSQHCLCEAADFVVKGVKIEDAFEKIKKSKIKFGQLILERSGGKEWIHISLGEPYRDKSKCRQVLVYDGVRYKVVQ